MTHLRRIPVAPVALGADKFIVAVWVLLALVLLVGCSSPPRVVSEKERATCEVPKAAVLPVDAPPKLVPGATNEDLRNREQQLEGLLEKCNARLADVPGAVNTIPAKPVPSPTLWGSLRSLFTKEPAP